MNLHSCTVEQAKDINALEKPVRFYLLISHELLKLYTTATATGFLNMSCTNCTPSNTSVPIPILEIFIPALVRFWITLVFEIFALFIVVLLLGILLFDRASREALHNHVFIALLIVVFFSQIIDVPNSLTYLRVGFVWPQTSANCYTWWFVNVSTYNTMGMLMAWASLERHIFIFHHTWLNTGKRRIFVHYVPLIGILVYSYTFYTVCVFFLPCTVRILYTVNWCAGPCFFRNRNLILFDTLVNSILPTLLIIIGNSLIFIRVIRQKRRLRQHIQWHKFRRMIIQLASCSALYLFLNLPLMSFALARLLFGVRYGVGGQFELFIYFMSSFIVLWMPFVCLGASPEMQLKLKQIFRTFYATNRIGVP